MDGKQIEEKKRSPLRLEIAGIEESKKGGKGWSTIPMDRLL